MVCNEIIILKLIRNGLVSTKLIKGLNRIGLVADDYTTSTPDIILLLLNIQIEDEEIEQYYLMFEEVENIEIKQQTNEFNELIQKIYYYILSYSEPDITKVFQ